MLANRKLWEENWVANKAGDTISLQFIWKNVLQQAKDIPLEQLNPLLRIIDKPSTIEVIIKSASSCEDPKHALEKLYEASGHFTPVLSEWVISIEIFFHWCASKQKKTDLSSSVDYVSCCAEWLESKPEAGTLSDITLEMLNKYGWEGEESSCSC